MNTFSNAVNRNDSNRISRTENGMKAFEQTDSKVLDLFSKIGSARQVDITSEFFAALSENDELTLRTLLWARDIREGSGERATFRRLLKALEKTDPGLAARLMPKIPELGRWDDLFTYEDALNRKKAFRMIGMALSEGNQLCAKWMPRKGETAVELRNFLGMSPKQYRKMLVRLTNVVEQKMCAKDFESINFSHVPSVASSRYMKAFWRNAPEAYSKWKAELTKPESERDPKVKINANAVYPYDVVKAVKRGDAGVADAQWDALPNFVGDYKILPMVDVSGSMGFRLGKNLTAMDVAVSLGLYLSSKCESDFKDMFLTFSRNSRIHKLNGSLSSKIQQMHRLGSDWGMNTNLHKAFDEILKVARNGNVSQENMPDCLLILTDMQFDMCIRNDDRALDMIRKKYADAGYRMPNIVFWNLNTAYGRDNTPVKFHENGTALVSGFSPSLMKSVLALDDLAEFTPYNVMLQTIMKDRYAL